MAVLNTRLLTEKQEYEMISWINDNLSVVESVAMLTQEALADKRPHNFGGRWSVKFIDEPDEAVYFIMMWC